VEVSMSLLLLFTPDDDNDGFCNFLDLRCFFR
jgi:hypothetical protein